MTQQFSVLMVCTGNICRSPAAERLLDAAGDGSVMASSAGTAAVVGDPISPVMADLLRASQVPVGGFAARQLTPELIDAADLVLTLSSRHRRWVVDRVPSAVRRTFTLLELAHVADAMLLPSGLTDAERMIQLVEAAPTLRLRPDVASKLSAQIDVPDPYGLGEEVYDQALRLIGDAIYRIIGLDPTGWLAPAEPVEDGDLDDRLFDMGGR